MDARPEVDLRDYVRGRVRAEPAVTARQLAAELTTLDATPRTLRTVYNWLAAAREELGQPRPDAPAGARVWCPADTVANLRAAALPGEDLAAVVTRLAAQAALL